VLSIDNTKVREKQVARLQTLRANRDQKKVDEALAALTKAAEGAKASGFTRVEGAANLLELSVNAARVRATLGK
jgi:methylmalonyl-CoA mutase